MVTRTPSSEKRPSPCHETKLGCSSKRLYWLPRILYSRCLISNSNISKVYRLTRGEDGQARQTASFMDKGLKPLFSKVIFCPFDFTNPLLGLDAYQCLQEEVIHIVRNAWDVNLYRPLSAFITPHISGVRYLIDFCAGSSCNPQLMFVSTQSTSLGLPMMADSYP